MNTHSAMRSSSRPWVPGLLSVVAAVCATLIAGTLGASPEGKLLGAVLAAAIPPMISAAGAYRGLRVTVAIGMTAGAMLFTYGGFTAFAYAAEQPSTFPLPPLLPPPEGHETGDVTPPRPPPPEAGIRVSPEQLRCTTAGCTQPVTIHSTGTAPLKIGKIEFDGEHAADFRRVGQCENQHLEPDQKCAFHVRFTPSGRGERHARLVIHQNLPGPPSHLPVEGVQPKQLPDLTISSDGLRCSYQRSDPGDAGVLQVRFRLALTNADTDRFTQQVRVTAKSPSGLAMDSRFVVSTSAHPALSTANLALKPAHFGRTHVIVISVDHRDEVIESNEKNNQTRISVSLPTKATPSALLPCHLERR